jgi:hypothetical protein
MTFTDTIETTGKILDPAGVAVIVIGTVVALATLTAASLRRRLEDEYRPVRHRLGRSIYLGSKSWSPRTRRRGRRGRSAGPSARKGTWTDTSPGAHRPDVPPVGLNVSPNRPIY